MSLVANKKALVFGVANDHSIAWGMAQALHAQGAELGFSYAGLLLEKRVRTLAESIGAGMTSMTWDADAYILGDIDTAANFSGDIGRVDYRPDYFEQVLSECGLRVAAVADARQRYYGVEAC